MTIDCITIDSFSCRPRHQFARFCKRLFQFPRKSRHSMRFHRFQKWPFNSVSIYQSILWSAHSRCLVFVRSVRKGLLLLLLRILLGLMVVNLCNILTVYELLSLTLSQFSTFSAPWSVGLLYYDNLWGDNV